MTQHAQQNRAYELDALARRLTASGDYKVLRRLVPRPVSPPLPLPGGSEQTGIVIDLETTGLDHSKDEIIELGMLKFRYSERGDITGISDIFHAFSQPSNPIPAAITKLTGITDAMVADHKIEAAAVEAFIAGTGIVIAHNANFDRKFAERAWPIFEHKPWTCSAREIDWKGYGFSGAKLSYLSAEAGFFCDAHRAIDDCHAVLELLSRPLPATCTTALSVLLDRARRTTCRIWAERSPYHLKDILKHRGYHWNAGADGSLRCWYVDVDADKRDAELKFLKEEIYQRDVALCCVEYSALERFSVRMDASQTQSSLPAKVVSDA
jgi:DNA polymerase III subunit epsilon